MTKKEKKSVAGLKPATSYSPVRGPNQDYGGVGVKNDNADYTISDEHIHKINPWTPAHAPEWEKETPKLRKALAAKLAKDTDPEGKQRMKKPLRKVSEGRSLAEIKEMLSLVSEDDMVKNLKPINLTGGSEARTNKLASMAAGKEATPAPVDKKKEAAAFLNKEEVEHIDEARGRPKKDSVSDSADEHPMMQARKVVSTRGAHPFTFADGKKHSMNPMTAHRILAHHDNLQTPSEKEAFATRIHKNVDSLQSWLHGKPHDEELPKISLGGSSKVGGLGGRSRPSISGVPSKKKK